MRGFKEDQIPCKYIEVIKDIYDRAVTRVKTMEGILLDRYGT